MTKKIALILIVLFCNHFLVAQNASDVLEKGIRIKTDEKLFLKYKLKDNTIRFFIQKDIIFNAANFEPLNDELFLSNKRSVNVYVRPLNPLNYSFEAESKLVLDPINQAASQALGSIFDVLKVAGVTPPDIGMQEDASHGEKNLCTSLNNNIIEIEDIRKALENDNKGEINKLFTKLKSLDFEDKNLTIDGLNNIKKSIAKIEMHFNHVESRINTSKIKAQDHFKEVENKIKKDTDSANKEIKDNLNKINKKSKLLMVEIKKRKKDHQNISNYLNEISSLSELKEVEKFKYDCLEESHYFVYLYLDVQLKDLETKMLAQKKRLENLKKVYKLVDDRKGEAMKNEVDKGCDWCLELKTVTLKKDSLVQVTITLKEGGYKLSDKGEIESVEFKDKASKIFKVRKFQQFVPEVSVGIAYTAFEYNTYNTTTNSNGDIEVADPLKKDISNLKISTMINFNYYIANSPLHPFLQIGAGINDKIPALLVGTGFRSNINGTRRLAISVGLAATWLQELDELEVGDTILGTDDIERDLKYEFSWPPKPYFGIQYNF